MRPHVQIFILARDRPEYLREAVTSACSQETKGLLVEVIVSDNSESNSVMEMMGSDFPNVRYTRRWPPTDSEKHIKKVISELSAEFIVLFHDDDVLLPNYCQKMMEVMQASPTVAAVGCNALILRQGITTNTKAFSRFISRQTFYDEKTFLEQYFVDDGLGVAPFPSYMYRISSLDRSEFNTKDGGKYSDGPFVSKKIRFGPIIWITDVLMLYRRHRDNDSGTLNINDYRKLWRYMGLAGIARNSKSMRNWRAVIWKEWLLQQRMTMANHKLIIPFTWRERVVHKVLLRVEMRRPYRFIFWRMLLGSLVTRLICGR